VSGLTAEVVQSPGDRLPPEAAVLAVPAVAARPADERAEREAADGSLRAYRHDFGSVRVHADPRAAASAAALSARAYTVGPHIVFGPGEYAPHTARGRDLLAHELTHVRQQQAWGEPRVQRAEFGTGARLDSLSGDPPRARLLAPYRDSVVAEELYGDPAAPLQFAPDDPMVVLVDVARLRAEHRPLFQRPTAPARNTWPFPGLSPEDVRNYLDERVTAVAVNLVSGRAFFTLDDGRTLEAPLSWCDTTDRDIVPVVPVRAGREVAAAQAAELSRTEIGRAGTVVGFYRSDGIVWPTLINPQTTPRVFSVFPQAQASARADVQATESTFIDLLFWYIGARAIPRGGSGASSTSRLVIEGGRQLTRDEMIIVGRLLKEGRTVRVLAESTRTGVRTADFLVDGVRTELKTISSLTSGDLSGALGRRILEGAGQAPNIIADVRQQANMTRELAERAARRAFGADTLRRIQQIRLIGNGFDLVIPRI
jgi:hypothetical protein